jgi:hypothetical protein
MSVRVLMLWYDNQAGSQLRYARITESMRFNELAVSYYKAAKLHFETAILCAEDTVREEFLSELANSYEECNAKIQRLSNQLSTEAKPLQRSPG